MSDDNLVNYNTPSNPYFFDPKYIEYKHREYRIAQEGDVNFSVNHDLHSPEQYSEIETLLFPKGEGDLGPVEPPPYSRENHLNLDLYAPPPDTLPFPPFPQNALFPGPHHYTDWLTGSAFLNNYDPVFEGHRPPPLRPYNGYYGRLGGGDLIHGGGEFGDYGFEENHTNFESFTPNEWREDLSSFGHFTGDPQFTRECGIPQQQTETPHHYTDMSSFKPIEHSFFELEQVSQTLNNLQFSDVSWIPPHQNGYINSQINQNSQILHPEKENNNHQNNNLNINSLDVENISSSPSSSSQGTRNVGPTPKTWADIAKTSSSPTSPTNVSVPPPISGPGPDTKFEPMMQLLNIGKQPPPKPKSRVPSSQLQSPQTPPHTHLSQSPPSLSQVPPQVQPNVPPSYQKRNNTPGNKISVDQKQLVDVGQKSIPKKPNPQNIAPKNPKCTPGPPSSGHVTSPESCLSSQGINPMDFDCNPKFAKFYVIKSYSEDDIHKSIKYSIWTSTDNGNKRLDKGFRENHIEGPVYLFFSVNASGQFCGVAQMMSPLDYSTKSDFWHQDKWNGQFSVKWIFIKDIPNSHFRHIRLVNNDNKPVTNSRDTQEVLLEPGREMLKTFKTFKTKTSILDDFEYYNKQEEEDRKLKQERANKTLVVNNKGTTTKTI